MQSRDPPAHLPSSFAEGQVILDSLTFRKSCILKNFIGQQDHLTIRLCLEATCRTFQSFSPITSFHNVRVAQYICSGGIGLYQHRSLCSCQPTLSVCRPNIIRPPNWVREIDGLPCVGLSEVRCCVSGGNRRVPIGLGSRHT